MRRGCWLAIAFLIACSSPGEYGYSRIYTPLDEERSAAAGASEYDAAAAERSPGAWRGKRVALFGVVKSRATGPGGTADLALGLRRLELKNACENEDENSCRVTVSDREHGVVHALVKLSSRDDIGKVSVAPGSLVRVVGEISDELAASDGAVVIRARYYRHWPREQFVTKR